MADAEGMKPQGGGAGELWECSSEVIGACIEVHRALGPGLLESAYEICLAQELTLRGVPFERQKELPVHFKGVKLECSYRMDFVIDSALILEVKAVERVLPVHEAQLISYLRLARLPVGLLVNFHTETIRRGLRRFTLKQSTPPDLPSPC